MTFSDEAAVVTPQNPGKAIMILSAADILEDYYGADLEIGQTFQPIPTTPLSVKRAPLSDLKKFKGHRNVVPINRWIDSVESFGRKNRIQPGDMVSYLDSILSGTAEAWFHEQYAVLANTPGSLLWRTWRKKLLMEFVNDVRKSDDLKEFNNLNYLDFLSFLEYANWKYFLRSQVYGNSAHFLYPESRLISEMYELLNVMVRQTLQQTYHMGKPHSWSQFIMGIETYFKNDGFRKMNDPCVIDRERLQRRAERSASPARPQKQVPNMPFAGAATATPAVAAAAPAVPVKDQPTDPKARCGHCGAIDHPTNNCPPYKARTLRCEKCLETVTSHSTIMHRDGPPGNRPFPRKDFAKVHFSSLTKINSDSDDDSAGDSDFQ
jgi:hypothetical protein